MKRVAVINDLSGFGRCSLAAALAVLPVMGHSPCALPTAVLSHQSEIPHAVCTDLTESMPRFIDAWAQNSERFDGVLTGYFSSGKQIDYAMRVIHELCTENSLAVIDPVMGDNGRLYPAYDAAACTKMRTLIKEADVLTPNLTELCILTDTDYRKLTARRNNSDYFDHIAAAAQKLAAGCSVIVTGIHIGKEICNLAIEGEKAEIIRTPKCGGSFSGTGDLFSAVVCGGLLNRKPLKQAVQTAADFIHKSIAETVKKPHNPMYGVHFEPLLTTLTEVK